MGIDDSDLQVYGVEMGDTRKTSSSDSAQLLPELNVLRAPQPDSPPTSKIHEGKKERKKET